MSAFPRHWSMGQVLTNSSRRRELNAPILTELATIPELLKRMQTETLLPLTAGTSVRVGPPMGDHAYILLICLLMAVSSRQSTSVGLNFSSSSINCNLLVLFSIVFLLFGTFRDNLTWRKNEWEKRYQTMMTFLYERPSWAKHSRHVVRLICFSGGRNATISAAVGEGMCWSKFSISSRRSVVISDYSPGFLDCWRNPCFSNSFFRYFTQISEISRILAICGVERFSRKQFSKIFIRNSDRKVLRRGPVVEGCKRLDFLGVNWYSWSGSVTKAIVSKLQYTKNQRHRYQNLLWSKRVDFFLVVEIIDRHNGLIHIKSTMKIS